MAVELKSLTLRGFKTYRELVGFEPGRLAVLVGANGAGKSNLMSFFSLLYRMMADPGELQFAVGKAGGASRLLHEGQRNGSIRARIELSTDQGTNAYEFRLEHAAEDTLIFAEENWSFQRPGFPSPQRGGAVAGHRESHLRERAFSGEDSLAYAVRSLLRKCVAYQFHDTSFTSGMRAKSSRADAQFLHQDGSNLAAYLLRLATGSPAMRQSYARIQNNIRQVIPFFAEFVLEPESGYVLLQWRERGSDVTFAASQASDGMLRIFALMTLLCQPRESLPAIMMLDEPELGLHPQAIMLVGALIRKVSEDCQVIVATQSTAFVDEFSLDEIVVLSRPGRESVLRRLSEKEYEVWLDEYSAGELLRKNVLEAGPGQ